MIKKLFFFFFVSISSLVYSQSADIRFSDLYTKKTELYSMADGDSSGFYFIRRKLTAGSSKIREIYLNKYDPKTMKLLFSKTLNFPSFIEIKKAELDLFLINGKPALLTIFTDKKTDNYNAYLSLINPETGEFEGEFKLLLKAKDPYRRYFKSGNNDGESPNTNLLFYYGTSRDEKGSYKYTFLSINEKLETEFKHDVTFNSDGDNFELPHAILSGSKIYALSNAFSATGKDSSVINLYIIDAEKKVLVKQRVVSPDAFTCDLTLRKGKNKTVFVAGLSSDQRPAEELMDWSRERKLKYAFVSIFSENGETLEKNVFNLPKKKNKDYAINFRVNNLLINSDNSYYFVVHEHSIYESGTQATKINPRPVTNGIFGTIMVFNSGTAYKSLTSTKIQRQLDIPWSYDFYALQSLSLNNKLYLIYRDGKENMTLDDKSTGDEDSNISAGNYMYFLTSVDPNGLISKKKLHDTFGDGTTLRTESAKKIGRNGLIIHGAGNRIASLLLTP